MSDESNDKLAAAIERLANESGEREAALRKLVEQLSPQDRKPQAEQDAQVVVDGLKAIGVWPHPDPPAEPAPSEGEQFLGKAAGQWVSTPGLLDE